MHYSDLLDRMKRNDSDAFLEMTDRYGWAVYSAIRQRCTDQETAEKLYNETMNGFYYALADSDAEDPLEALLYVFANGISPEESSFKQNIPESWASVPEIQLSQAQAASQKSIVSKKKQHGFWDILLVILMLILLIGCLWIIVGFLMKMNYIPYFDLGYSWLDTHVMQLLQ